MRLSVGNNGEDRTVSNNDSGLVCKDAESLFRTKPISDIRNVESQTQARIKSKKEELRQLVGNRYRDLIDSADSIVSMKSSCHSISSNISAIHLAIHSLSSETPKLRSSNPSRAKLYGIACRVKYLVDTPENIWGCLDEYMFLEAAARYIRAKHVQQSLSVIDNEDKDAKILPNFPLLQHQLLIVESFKAQISQRSRERLLVSDLGIGSYADALAAVAAIDELDPKQVLGLFLDSRKSWILQKLGTCFGHFDYSAVISVFCEVLRIIQVSIGQVGELFLQVLSDMPLYYKIILSSPPASQLFGGIPNPDEEVRLWKVFRERLESATIMLDRGLIAKTCSGWLRNCALEIVNKIHGKYLIDVISSGEELALTEKSIRETMDSKEVLEGSLEWLKSVFGSEIELPWSRIRELVLEDDADLWDVIFEDAFVQRMRMIIDLQFETLSLDVHVSDSVHAVKNPCEGGADFLTYLNRSSAEGGVWFTNANIKKANSGLGSKPLPEENDFCSCLNAYFGPEVSRIQDAADSRCRSVLEDLLCFLESPKAAWRLKDLAPYLQLKCHECMSTILRELKDELDHLYVAMDAGNKDDKSVPVSLIVERSLFIGRLLFAFENHTKHVPLILGSPRLWAEECITRFNNLSTIWGHFKTHIEPPIFDSPGRQRLSISKRQTSLAASALRAGNDSSSPKLKELQIITQNLCIKAYNLWILWICDELSVILSRDLRQDDGLTATTSSRGWEETIVKQGESDEGTTDLKISLPSTPSLYITSFLFRACGEIHRVGGHVLNKSILQQLALRLSEKAIDIFEEFLFSKEAPQVSEKGVLQLLLDIKFSVDVLSGGDANMNADTSKIPAVKHTFRRKQDHNQSKSVTRDRANVLIKRLSQRLDPIDWLTYEPYIWENEKQTYLRHAVLFGFFVQLNRMHTDAVQKLTTNAESNIMRCSTVPRFKYLPISAPALSSRGTAKASTVSADDIFSTSPWKAYTNEEFSRKFDFNDGSNFGVAAPFLKSFMQVGSRFGESTLKLSSMLTDGQVAKLKEKSAASMFGDILPVQAAGLLSSFTAARSDS